MTYISPSFHNLELKFNVQILMLLNIMTIQRGIKVGKMFDLHWVQEGMPVLLFTPSIEPIISPNQPLPVHTTSTCTERETHRQLTIIADNMKLPTCGLVLVAMPITAQSGGNYCGTGWMDAVSRCAKPCPSGAPTDCMTGETCFAGTPVSTV